jgi:hypothetical protein
MIQIVQKQNILVQWVFWHFIEMPKNILKSWKDIFRFYLNYFSIPLLLKTLFAPWRHNLSSYPKGFDLGEYFEIFISNLISRTIGAILRFFLILIGFFVEILIILAGIIILFIWFVLPFCLIFGFSLSFKIFF